MSGRCKMAQVRSMLTDVVDHMKVKSDISLVSDRKKMKCGVCGAAESHIGCQRVLKCCRCYDITRTDIIGKQLHNLHTSCLCKADTLCVYSRDRTISRKAETKNFC